MRPVPRQSSGRLLAPFALCLGLLLAPLEGCKIQQSCYGDRDCTGIQVCDVASGACVWECEQDSDCDGFNFTCEDHSCQFQCLEGELDCPEGMADICGAYCIDKYEASRPDATADHGGSDESMPLSQPGVIPWYNGVLVPAQAHAACQTAGKRLCSPQEWEVVCSDIGERVYIYGDEYDPSTCNGIDTYCDPDDCGVYPGCYHDCPHSNYHAMPTGSFPDCTNPFGIFDMSGNVWEAVLTDDGVDHFHGGANNCGDSQLAHQCAYDGLAAGTFPTDRGFRCCSNGTGSP